MQGTLPLQKWGCDGDDANQMRHFLIFPAFSHFLPFLPGGPGVRQDKAHLSRG